MKSYSYMGYTYHKRTSFYYIDSNKIQSIEIMNNVPKNMRFKTHEKICDYIEDLLGVQDYK